MMHKENAMPTASSRRSTRPSTPGMIECLEGRRLMSATEFSPADPMAAAASPGADSTAIDVGGTVSAWFTCLKSCAESKAQIQGELARFR
jgi:hypothetical protein